MQYVRRKDDVGTVPAFLFRWDGRWRFFLIFEVLPSCLFGMQSHLHHEVENHNAPQKNTPSSRSDPFGRRMDAGLFWRLNYPDIVYLQIYKISF